MTHISSILRFHISPASGVHISPNILESGVHISSNISRFWRQGTIFPPIKLDSGCHIFPSIFFPFMLQATSELNHNRSKPQFRRILGSRAQLG